MTSCRVDWAARKKLAATCTSWAEFVEKIGMDNNSATRLWLRKHGINFGLLQKYPPLPESVWEERRKIALTCGSWREVAEKLGLGVRGISQMTRSHGVVLGRHDFNVGPRSSFPEEEWARLRALAATCRTWEEYDRKGGTVMTDQTFRRHGVKLGCYQCGGPSVGAYYPGGGKSLHRLCTSCAQNLQAFRPKHVPHTPEAQSEALACSIAHKSEGLALRILALDKEVAEYRWVHEKYQEEALLFHWPSSRRGERFEAWSARGVALEQRRLDIERQHVAICKRWKRAYRSEALPWKEMVEEAKSMLLNSRDPENPFTDPAFLQKLLYDDPGSSEEREGLRSPRGLPQRSKSVA